MGKNEDFNNKSRNLMIMKITKIGSVVKNRNLKDNHKNKKFLRFGIP